MESLAAPCLLVIAPLIAEWLIWQKRLSSCKLTTRQFHQAWFVMPSVEITVEIDSSVATRSWSGLNQIGCCSPVALWRTINARAANVAASLVVLTFLAFLTSGCGDTRAAEPEVEWLQPKIRAITLDSRGPIDAATIVQLQSLGVTHLTLITFGWQQSSNVGTVSFRSNGRWFTESDSGIVATANIADSLGMHVVVKPHLWVRDTRGGDLTRDRIGFDTEDEWVQWQESYRAFIMHYARLSQVINAPFFVIGTELRRAARERPEFWRQLIADVRKEYDGQLTYASNWYEEYKEVSFWDSLDFIGIQAYFPVSGHDSPAINDMTTGWIKHRNSIQSIAAQYDKAVLFTEIGYRSEKGVAKEPWAWAPNRPSAANRPDYELQADLYEAFFQTFWDRPWFSGAIVWKWNAHTRVSDQDAIDFTLQGKPASDVIARWFLGPTVPTDTVSASR